MAKLTFTLLGLVGFLVLAVDACPTGWKLHGGSCYYFSPRSSATSWALGKSQCEARGANYVVINYRDEMNFIKSNTDWGWVGGSDRQKEGTFIWEVSPSQSMWFTNWASGEPNGGSRENCIELKNDGTWNDASCSNQSIYICEKPACPTRWKRHGGHCYYFSPRSTATTWASGKAQCEAMGAKYVVINGRDEMDFIKGNTNWGWVGGTDRQKEGTFIWEVSPTQAMRFTNWASGEPSGSFREDCIELNRDGTWNDASCSNQRIYICEKPA